MGKRPWSIGAREVARRLALRVLCLASVAGVSTMGLAEEPTKAVPETTREMLDSARESLDNLHFSASLSEDAQAFPLYPTPVDDRPSEALLEPDEFGVEAHVKTSLHYRPDVSVQAKGSSRSRDDGSLELGLEFQEAYSALAWSEEDPDSTSLSKVFVYRDFNERGFVRAGRYEPNEFSTVGQIDGFQGEMHLGHVVRTGVIAGVLPRSESDTSDEESLAVAYVGTEVGDPNQLHYSGTVGFMGTTYDGDSDRLAVLVEQKARLSPHLELSSSSAVDIAPVSESGDDLRLTTLNLEAESSVTSFLTLRAGVEHSKRPDSRAERALRGAEASDSESLDGTWSHWLGGTQTLPWNLELEGDIAFKDSLEEGGQTESWQVGLARRGLPALPEAKMSLEFFTHDYGDDRTYASTVSGTLPLYHQEVVIEPSFTFDVLGETKNEPHLSATDLALHAVWRPVPQLTVFAGTTYSFREEDDGEPIDVEVGMQFYW